MNHLTEQLAATRKNLERLERLVASFPDLFPEACFVTIATVTPEEAVVYIHALRGDLELPVDWLALARKYSQAKWQRVGSPAYHDRYDWEGEIDGVCVKILGAEKRPDSMPLPLEPHEETRAA